MGILWAVPAVAACVAVLLVLVRMRTWEELSVDLASTLQRSGELRSELTEVRQELARSAPLADRVWDHWAESENGDPEG